MTISYNAMIFAMDCHKDQTRKYTGNPYSDHLAEVAGIVGSIYESSDASRIMAVAWLHDCMEDQNVKYHTLFEQFGEEIANGVGWLSDLEIGNRATRKEASRIRLSLAPDWVQNIKCADIISNTSSILKHDPNFAKIYLEEKRMLLNVLSKADPRLINLAHNHTGV